MIQPYGLESGIYRYYVNSDNNKIKEVPEAEDEDVYIITCPIKLDYIISFALTHPDLHVLITWQLLDVINNLFDNCAKECPYWNEYIKWVNEEWQSYYQSNPHRNWPFMEVQHQIHKLYNAKTGQDIIVN